MRLVRTAVSLAACVVLLAACTTSPSGNQATSPPASSPQAAPSTPAAESSAPAPTVTTSTPAPNPVSIPALFEATYDGSGLTLGQETGSTTAYRQYLVTYRGDGLTISGRMNIPRTGGPFPAVVLAHGYADPAVYDNSTQMARERDYLARQGYVTLLVDYRNHGGSSKDPANDAGLRLGYTKDVVNAALALQQYPGVDGRRLGLVGRSMGGGVVYNVVVAKPGLFRAAVAYAPVSSDTVDNFDKWERSDPGRAADEVIAKLGTPESAPQAWAQASPRTFFGRITEPLQIHHGTADLTCPIAWTEATVAALRQAGKAVDYQVYPGQRHIFTTQWQSSIERTTAFLGQHLT
jgi:dipeptidyl aminopeptidase/acylaminoacyl peptidase